jgi:glycosyltransferase involved in cell wall biosynthesis
MRLLIATTVHHPLDARIHHRQVRALRRAGVAVTYAAPFTATGTDPAALAAGVVALDLPRASGRRRLRALRAARRTLALHAAGHDLILLHDPELVLAVAGQLDRLPPVVLDVHEDLAASLGDRDWLPAPLTPLAVRLARWLEATAHDRLAGVLLAEHSYRARFGDDQLVVLNLPWLPPTPPPAATVNRVVYVGRLSVGRGTGELLEMARRLADEPGAPEVHLIGPADDAVAPAVRRAHADGLLTWHGFLPNPEALALVAGSVAGLAPLRDLPNYHGSLPTKVVEYLAHGVPAIVTPLPEAADLVRASGGGEVVPFEDAAALTAAVRSLASDPQRSRRMGAAGREHVERVASWDAVAPDFVAHLRRLAGCPEPALEHRSSHPERPGRSGARNPRIETDRAREATLRQAQDASTSAPRDEASGAAGGALHEHGAERRSSR